MMEEESFQNEEIGQLLNEDFVCVKVDREERPDVDKVYMTFVQVSGLPMEGWGGGCLCTRATPLTLAPSLLGHQQWWGLAHECVVDSQPPALCGGHLFPPGGWPDPSWLSDGVAENTGQGGCASGSGETKVKGEETRGPTRADFQVCPCFL